MKISNIYFSLFCSLSMVCYSQTKCDHELLNDVLPLISRVGAESPQNIYTMPLEFQNQEKFFTKAFLEDYTHPVLGVDSLKVRELIKILDLPYLAAQKRVAEPWDFSKLHYKINPYENYEKNSLNGQRQLQLAKPIYTEDKKMAFVYYLYICGDMDCSSKTVKVFKKENGKWTYYVQIPVSLGF